MYGLHNSRIRNQLMNSYGTSVDLNEVIRVAKIQEECEFIDKSRNSPKVRNVQFQPSSEEDYDEPQVNQVYERSQDDTKPFYPGQDPRQEPSQRS
jgi:hypothetical protein